MYSILQLALTVALASYASATTYAQFCNDSNCSEGCGISVSVDNPGCLAESGRQSVSFHDINIQQVALVSSPDSACSCQNYCYSNILFLDSPGIYSAPGCLPLTGPTALSYRFTGDGTCDLDNC